MDVSEYRRGNQKWTLEIPKWQSKMDVREYGRGSQKGTLENTEGAV